MKFLKLFFSICIIFSFSLLLQAQQTQFNIDLYKKFLQSHQNMLTSDLLNVHPTGIFTADVNMKYQDALFFDSINLKYDLTDYEELLI